MSLENKFQTLRDKGISERDKFIALMSEELKKRRIGFFVGAGCSIFAGLPSWEKLIKDQLEKYHIKTNDSNLIRIATRLEKEIGSLKFRENIIRALSTNYSHTSRLHDVLAQLEAHLYITTNYDHILEDTLNKYGYAPQVIWSQKDIPSLDLSKKVVIKLHGDIVSPTSLVITSRDYFQYKTDQKAFIEWLNSTAARYSLVFIGSSFDDPRLKEMDEHVLSLFSSFRLSPFIFLKIPDQNDAKDDDYEVVLDDFQFQCEEFANKNYNVLIIENYSDLVLILTRIVEELTKYESDGDDKIAFDRYHATTHVMNCMLQSAFHTLVIKLAYHSCR